jgi:hypothetical protein
VRDSDGRLDLDDLGDVLGSDSAAQLDSDVLGEETGTTWAERLETLGLTPWLRRHARGIALLATAVVVVTVGGTWFARSRPLPLDPVIRASAVSITPTPMTAPGGDQPFDTPGIYVIVGAFGSPAADDVRWTAYAIQPDSSNDTSTYTVVGVTGPGLRASQAHPRAPATNGVPFAADLAVVVDCSDPATLTPTFASYRLTVTRQDPDGRRVSGEIEAPEDTASWASTISQTCLGSQGQQALSTRSLTAVADASTRTVLLNARLHQDLPVGTVVTFIDSHLVSSTVITTAPPVELPAQGDAVVPITLSVRDCAAPALDGVTVLDRSGTVGTQSPGVYATLSLADRADSATTLAIPFTAAQGAVIERALRDACAGAPATTTTLLSVAGTASGASGLEAEATISLDVAATASRVSVASPAIVDNQLDAPQFGGASGATHAGHARITVSWGADCSQGYLDKPILAVTVITDHGRFPYLVPVQSPSFTRLVLDQCPTLVVDSLVGNGWATPSP